MAANAFFPWHAVPWLSGWPIETGKGVVDCKLRLAYYGACRSVPFSADRDLVPII